MNFWLVWAVLGISILYWIYDQYAFWVAKGTGGIPVLGLTIASKSEDLSDVMKAVVIFASNPKACPGQEALRQVHGQIEALLTDVRPSNSEIQQFIEAIQQPWQGSTRHRIPELLTGGVKLYAADIELPMDRVHPTWDEHGFVVLSKTGESKGKVFLLPWQSAPAQKIFRGIEIKRTALNNAY